MMSKIQTVLWGIFYTLLVLSIGFFLGRFSSGHEGFRRPENRRAMMKVAMVRELGLSDTQSKQIDLILDRHRPFFDEHISQMRQLRDQLDADIAVILTSEQKQRFDKMKRHHRLRHREN